MQEDQLATLYLAATVVNDQLGQPSTPLSPSPKNLDGLRKRLLTPAVGVPLKRHCGPMPANVVFVEAERTTSPTPPSSPMEELETQKARVLEERRMLSSVFERCAYPGKKEIEHLARLTGRTPRSVSIFFQNARQCAKNKQKKSGGPRAWSVEAC